MGVGCKCSAQKTLMMSSRAGCKQRRSMTALLLGALSKLLECRLLSQAGWGGGDDHRGGVQSTGWAVGPEGDFSPLYGLPGTIA